MNWLLYAVVGALLAGASPVFAKSGMHKSSAFLAAALRGTFLFFGAWFMAHMTGVNGTLTGLGRTQLLYLLFSGIATGMVWICLLRALQIGEVTRVVPVVAGSAALNILVGIFLFHEAVTWNKIVILILLTAGAVMMGMKSSGRGGKSHAWLGYSLAAMLLTTVTVMLERIGYAEVNAHFERLVRYGIALVIVWLAAFATKGYKKLRSMSFLDGMYLCISGAVMGGSWYCFHKAYALGTNVPVEFVEHFDLVAAVVLACIFMRERMTVHTILGLIFMMLGFGLLQADLPMIPL